jgi:hypothetical protein
MNTNIQEKERASMRSYSYSEGKWQLYKDTLPATVSLMTSGNYQATSAYREALEKIGFAPYSSDSYMSRFGQVLVYARNHASLPPERKANEAFDFLRVLSIGGSYIRIWIPDLSSFFLFLVDIDAKSEDFTLAALKDFLNKKSLQDLIVNISMLADQMWQGDTEITISPSDS